MRSVGGGKEVGIISGAWGREVKTKERRGVERWVGMGLGKGMVRSEGRGVWVGREAEQRRELTV